MNKLSFGKISNNYLCVPAEIDKFGREVDSLERKHRLTIWQRAEKVSDVANISNDGFPSLFENVI